MTVALLTAFVFEWVAFVVYLDRQNTKHASQVADLCQRLQAPETAVAQHVVGSQAFEPSHLPFDDDGAWLKYVGDQPVIGTDDLG